MISRLRLITVEIDLVSLQILFMDIVTDCFQQVGNMKLTQITITK